MEVQQENARANSAAAKALSCGELKMMLGQCLKMASENKITSSNTWGLPLIEHLDSLIKEDGVDKSTNFQKASVTLDAGVKIYSYRVDSVHTETFKILGGLGRASGPRDDESGDPGKGGVDGENTSPSKRKRRNNELNPETTLEPSFDAINVKKFDLAFAVDPLFHKTSAQFDEGGARGLLLNNLSVYKGCEIVFDSMDVPEKALDESNAATLLDAQVDLSTVQQQLQAVTASAENGTMRISPALDELLGLLGGAAGSQRAVAQVDAFVQHIAETAGDVRPMRPIPNNDDDDGGHNAMDTTDTAMDNTTTEGGQQQDDAAPYIPPYDDDDYGGGDFGGGYDDDNDDQYDNNDGSGGFGGEAADGAHHNNTSNRRLSNVNGSVATDLGEDAIHWLISAGSNGVNGVGGDRYVTGAKGWAGASHWRFRSVPQHNNNGNGIGTINEDGEQEVDGPSLNGRGGKKRGGGGRKKNEPLDFVELMKGSEPTFEMLPRTTTRKTKAKKPVSNTLLPEDHHYQAASLARYALRPRCGISFSTSNTMRDTDTYNGNNGGNNEYRDDDFMGGDFMGGADDDDHYNDDDGSGDAYGSGNGGDWAFDLANQLADNPEGGLQLVDAARKVEKVDVNYSKAAKQVDVRSLKELMWNGIQQVVGSDGGDNNGVLSLHDVLQTVPEYNAAGRLQDLSVHLCFICVLHLANEHGLVVKGVNELDNLMISNVPALV